MKKLDQSIIEQHFGLACTCQDQAVTGQLGGFFGKLWNTIKSHGAEIFGAIGGVVGGPVGAAVGAAFGLSLQQMVDPDIGTFWRAGEVELDMDIDFDSDAYPVSGREETEMSAWFRNVFFPEIANIANEIDFEVVNTASRGTTVSTPVDAINSVLRKISVLKIYANHIMNYGEQEELRTGVVITRSDNFCTNKANFMLHFLNILEKAVLDYSENATPGYKLILKDETVSQTATIGAVKLLWSGSVVGKVKRYVTDDTQLTGTEQEISVVNTDVLDPAPALDPASNETANQTTTYQTTKSISWLKVALWGSLGFFTLKAYQKAKKNNNK